MNIIHKLIIHLNQNPIGTLAQKDGKIYFEYNKEFLKSGIQISPYKLPLKAGLFRCDDDTFEGLWGLKSRPNPYAKQLKKQVTMRLETEGVGIPYQSLINLYLRDCVSSHRELNMKWQ